MTNPTDNYAVIVAVVLVLIFTSIWTYNTACENAEEYQRERERQIQTVYRQRPVYRQEDRVDRSDYSNESHAGSAGYNVTNYKNQAHLAINDNTAAQTHEMIAPRSFTVTSRYVEYDENIEADSALTPVKTALAVPVDNSHNASQAHVQSLGNFGSSVVVNSAPRNSTAQNMSQFAGTRPLAVDCNGDPLPRHMQ